MTRIIRFILLVALLSFPRAAQADGVHTFDVDYTAPDGCPESREFMAQVVSRTRLARPSTETPEFRFTLRISDTPDGPRGALLVRGPDQTESRREVPGDDCSSVVQAAALIAALVLDPHATAGELAPPPSTSGEVAVSPSDSNVPPAPATRSDLPFRDMRPVALEYPASAARWEFGVAAGPTLQSAIAPTVAPGASLGIRLARDTSSVVAPMFGIDGQVAASTVTQGDVGSASFTWLAVRSSVCPVRLPSGAAPIVFRPCAFFDAGVVRAVGDNTFRPQEQTVPWLSVGALGRVEWAAARSVSLELGGGGMVPVTHDRYLFLPDVTVHQVPAIGFLAALGATLWIR